MKALYFLKSLRGGRWWIKSKSRLLTILIRLASPNKHLNFSATFSAEDAHHGPEFISIATPTDYGSEINYFDSTSIKAFSRQVMFIHINATRVVKPAIVVGYTKRSSYLFVSETLVSPECFDCGDIIVTYIPRIQLSANSPDERGRLQISLSKQELEEYADAIYW